MLLRNSNKTSSFFAVAILCYGAFFTHIYLHKKFFQNFYIQLYILPMVIIKLLIFFLCICVSTIKLHDYWLLVVFTLAQCTNFFRYFFCVSYFFRYSISKHLNISIYYLFFCASDIDIFTLCVHIYRNEYSNSFTLVIRNL